MSIFVNDENIRIDGLQLGPYGTNAYIVRCQATGDSLVVDSPGGTEEILCQLKGTNPKYILITHNHFDHLGALSELESALRVPVAAHASDASGLTVQPSILLNDGEILSLGNLDVKVLHTPGHTPGSLCFLIGIYLLSGDTIFPGGPGKTGSPKRFKEIVESIKRKIFILSDDTLVYPGHGDTTILEKEKAEFAIFSSKSHSPDLCGDVLWLES
ncbi:MAG: MBL fold metallo-hydrolase [Thermodesulfobacteriota bacterium]|nr:MBL fold metallo-hydrolase [Thermodesulfobacteriota bacterium]